jgi:yecA family protein
MPDPIPQAGSVDLDALDAFLLSDRAPGESMGLSDLDGFLTGIAIGPELILPSEWLPVVWGGGEPTFESAEEAGSILGIIMGRYNEIVRTLAAAPEDLDPVFWEGPEGQVIVADWAAGYLDAVALRPQAWEPLVLHPEARTLMLPLLLLGADGPDDLPIDDVTLPEVDLSLRRTQVELDHWRGPEALSAILLVNMGLDVGGPDTHEGPGKSSIFGYKPVSKIEYVQGAPRKIILKPDSKIAPLCER